jgi:hypothetical protein
MVGPEHECTEVYSATNENWLYLFDDQFQLSHVLMHFLSTWALLNKIFRPPHQAEVPTCRTFQLFK